MASTPSGRGVRAGLAPIVTLLSSNVLGAFAGGVFFLVASRAFDLDEMGRYAVAIGVQWVLVGLTGSGVSVAAIRIAADDLERGDRAGAAGLIALSVLLAAAPGLGLGAIGFVASAVGAPAVFELDAAVLAWAALWGAARSVIDAARSGLLVERRYGRAAALMVLTAVTGLGALGLTLAAAPLTLERLLVAHAAGLGSAALVGLALLRPLAASGVRFAFGRAREIVGYAKWPASSEGLRMLQVHLGPFLLTGLAGAGAAGLFTLGRYPAYVFEVVAVSLYQYWLPEAARHRAREGFERFLSVQLRLAALVGAGMLVAAIATRPLLPWLGPNFEAAGLLFVLNTADFALFLLARPMESVFHGLHRPGLEFVGRVVRLPLLAGLGWWLVGPFGAEGMAWAHVVTGAVALGGVGVLLRYALPR